MIPDKILRFLDQYGNLAFAGTRDHDLMPYGHRVSGWRAAEDGRTLTAFITEGSMGHLLESLAGAVVVRRRRPRTRGHRLWR